MSANLKTTPSPKMNIHPAIKYNRFNMFFSFVNFSNFYFWDLTFIFFGGFTDWDKPFSFIFTAISDSIFKRINRDLPSTNAERNSLTSLFKRAMLYTFLSALWELAIIMSAKPEIKMIKRQFLNESSFTKNVPFNML